MPCSLSVHTLCVTVHTSSTRCPHHPRRSCRNRRLKPLARSRSCGLTVPPLQHDGAGSSRGDLAVTPVFDVVKDGWEELRATPSGATRTATLMMQRRVREIPVGRCRPDRSLQPLRWLGWSTWSGRHPRNIRVVGSAGASDGTAANARPLHLIHGGASVISRLPSAQPQCQDRVRPGAPHHLVDGDVLVHCVREDCLAGAVLQRRHSGHCVLSQV